MKKNILFLSMLSIISLACNNSKPKEESNNYIQKAENKPLEYDLQNYAAVWNWATDDVNKVSKFSPKIAEELLNLWNNAKVENVYYNPNNKKDKLAHFPNVAFFVKAKDKQNAEAILNQLTVVKEGIANYKLFPVGTLWLKRKEKIISQKGVTKSFVSIWSTSDKQPQEQVLQAQNDTILRLWNNGEIENVYFDLSQEQTSNEKTDFVFFINTHTEEEAKKLCKSLPFYKQGLASYKIHQVGVHWMGIADK